MRKKKDKLYCADFETTPYKQSLIEKRTRVYLYQIMDVDTKESKVGISIDDFFDYLKSIKYERFIVYFHNLSFDGEFILWYLMEHNYKNVDELVKEHTFTSLITDDGSIYVIKVKLDNGNVVEFKCSYKLMPNSISDIGKMFGIPKLNETHNYEEMKNYTSIDDVTDEELMYINNDVRILRELIWYLKNNNMLNITLSSNAYKFWRKDKYMFSKCNLVKPDNPRINEIVDKSYRGGITKVNPQYKGKLVENVISFDVNSLYPSVMYDNSMPVGKGEIYKSVEDGLKNGKKKFIVSVYVSRAKIIDGYQAFIGFGGFSCATHYVYKECLFNVELNLWLEEFELFKLCYEGEYNIVEVVGFDSANYVFKNYIDYWIEVKNNATLTGNLPERNFAKRMLNALYGKFGMNQLRYSKVPVGVLDGEIEYQVKEKMSCYYYKPIASYITSLARCKLVSAIIMCRDRFIYCDTDSIYLKGTELPDIPIDDVKLGYWKFEHHYLKFKSLKAKCYLKCWEENGKIIYDSSIAGLPKDSRGGITFDNFEDGLKIENAKKCKVRYKGGIVIKPIEFTIKV